MQRKRVLIPALALVMLALAATALASTGATKVKSRSTNRGQLLSNRRGHLLYIFAPDKRNKDVCVKKAGCTSVWPPVTTTGKPIAGPGVKSSMLGTITIAGGTQQVTYDGHPLYRWTNDPGGGDTSYIGVPSTGGKWWAITTAGKVVR